MLKNSKKNTQNALIDLHVCKIYVKFKGENSWGGLYPYSPWSPTKYAEQPDDGAGKIKEVFIHVEKN